MLLSGKRLLFLGAGQFQLPAIQAAKELGAFVVVTDNVPSNPGHRLGDASENASTVDLEACLAVARKHRVDGVMTYGSDVSTPAVAYVAEQLGLPGNPLSAARTLQSKDLVREFQRDHGLNHPAFIKLRLEPERLEAQLEEVRAFPFPGVVKPVDSSGSKGISIVRHASEVPEALARARPFSRKNLAVLEQFLARDILELDGDVWVKDGKLAFRHYGHNYFSKKSESLAPIGEIFPGYFSEQVAAELDAQLEKLIRGLGIENGCMNFDGAVAGGKVYLFDVALRNGGNFVPLLIQRSSGFDITRAAVCTALGVDYPCEGRVAKNARPVASYVVNSPIEGRFAGVAFEAPIRDYVSEQRLFVEVGSPVLPFTRGDRALGVVIFEFSDMTSMRDCMDRVEDLVRVLVEPIAS